MRVPGVFCLAHCLSAPCPRASSSQGRVLAACLAQARHGLGSISGRCHPRGHPVLVPTGNVTQLRRRGHFSRCPEEYRHYCVKGRCRFLVAEAAPACV